MGPPMAANTQKTLGVLNLHNALFKRSIRKRKAYTQDAPLRRSTDDILWYPTHHHTLKKLWVKPVNCSACIKGDRKSQKVKGRYKPLLKLSTNTTKKCRDSKDWKRP